MPSSLHFQVAFYTANIDTKNLFYNVKITDKQSCTLLIDQLEQ